MNVVLDFIKTLVWPMIVAGALIGYRPHVRELLSRMTKLDTAGIKATFEAAAQQAQELTATAEPDHHALSDSATGPQRIVPTTFLKAREIGDAYRGGTPVIIDMTQLPDKDAVRVMDFITGLVFQADGSMDKLGGRVYLISQPSPDSAA